MRKKKLYYLPGIISIIGLPVLLFFWGPPDPVRENSIEMVLPSADHSTTAPVTEAMIMKSVKDKKMLSLRLNDMVWNGQSAFLLQQKFKFVATQIESLQFANDTNAVLKISFGATNQYGQLMWVLNPAMVYDLRRYAMIGNDLYLFANPPVQPRYATIELPMLQTPRGWGGLSGKWRLAKLKILHLFQHQQQNKWLALGFVLLILIPTIIQLKKPASGKLTLSIS